jgi:diguanylate cyclase (GGDEF)-like protein
LNQQNKEVKEVFLSFLETYLKNRDYEKTIAFFSKNINGFGTSRDECGYDRDRCEMLFKRDIHEAPDPIEYQINTLHVTSPKKDIGLISCTLNLDLMLYQQALKLNDIRYTLVFVKNNNQWLIEHKHMSYPSIEHGENEPYPIKEIEKRNVVLERLVKQKTKELQQSICEITKLATIDKLTQINNRFKIDEVLTEKCLDQNNQFSIIMIDIDHFKQVNDQFGHHTGDIVLKEIAQHLNRKMKKTDILGRWGGEEFLIITTRTKVEQLLKFTEQLKVFLTKLKLTKIGHLTGSFGIAISKPNETPEDIVLRADQALYQAKSKGRNSVVLNED